MSGKKLLIALLVLFVLLTGIKIFLLLRPSDKPLCERIDPAQCYITTRVYNDTDQTFEISLCSTNPTYGCQKTTQSHTLGPNFYYQDVMDPDVEHLQVWLVKDDNHEIAGCAVFKFTKKDAPLRAVVPISHLESCEGYWGN